MRPLPAMRYEYADWKKAIVNIDYHGDAAGHYYSVPHSLVKQKIDVRMTATTVECFFKGKRVATHLRSSLRGRHTTVAEHMPESHRKHLEWTPGRLLNGALAIGSPTRKSVKSILDAKLDQHPDLFPSPASPPQASPTPPQHANVRGADYFRSTTPGDSEPCSSNPPLIH